MKTGSITVKLEKKIDKINYFFYEFFNFGWKMNCYDKISFLPKGDEDFDWQFTDSSNEEKIINVITSKFSANELIGIVISWKNTNIGCTVLCYPDYKKIIFNLDTNKKTLNNLEISDYSWYLEKIIPIFNRLKLVISCIECLEG